MSAKTGRNLFVALMVVIASVMSSVLAHKVMSGQAVPSFDWILIASAGLIVTVWLLVQRRQPALSTFNWQTISYAAVVGDTIVLPTLIVVDANGWESLGDAIGPFWKGWVWYSITLLIGLAVGIGLHKSGGKSDSKSFKIEERLHDSATSWAHNLGVVTTVGSVIPRTVIPLFTVSSGWLWAGITLVLLVFGWGGLVVADEIRRRQRKFDPHWLDTIMDWTHWRPLRPTQFR